MANTCTDHMNIAITTFSLFSLLRIQISLASNLLPPLASTSAKFAKKMCFSVCKLDRAMLNLEKHVFMQAASESPNDATLKSRHF